MFSFLLFAFAFGALLVLGSGLLVRTPLERRLARLEGPDLPLDELAPTLSSRAEAWLAPLARRAGGDSEEIRARLVRAGYRDERSLVLFVGGRLLAPVVFSLLAVGVLPLFGLSGSQCLVGAVLAALVSYGGPGIVLERIGTARLAEIRSTLPDALDLMLVCLEAGLALGGALSRVARELVQTSPPLCDELRLVTREMQAGKSSAEALEAFAERVDIEDVKALVAMLVQSERFGTGVADALRVHTSGMRRRRMQDAEERAGKAAVKMLIPTAVFILPATLIVLLGPSMLKAAEVFGKQ